MSIFFGARVNLLLIPLLLELLKYPLMTGQVGTLHRLERRSEVEPLGLQVQHLKFTLLGEISPLHEIYISFIFSN